MSNHNSEQNPNSDSPSDGQEDPDLGFASESHHPFGPSGRKAFESSSSSPEDTDAAATNWTPKPQPTPPAVPRAKKSDDDDQEERNEGMGDTWVPPHPEDTSEVAQPSEAASADAPSNEPLEKPELDPNQTWVPSNTPTTDGLASPNGESEVGDSLNAESRDCDSTVDPSQTWVPSNTPTMDGTLSDDDSGSEDFDPDQTWAPPSAASANGGSQSESVDTDFAGTRVPPENSAAQNENDVSAGGDEPADFEKTWVPSETPTADGHLADSPADALSSNDAESGDESEEQQLDVDSTWVMPAPDLPAPVDEGSSEASNAEDDVNRTWVPSGSPTDSGLKPKKLPADLTETVDTIAGAKPVQPVNRGDSTVDMQEPKSSDREDGRESTATGGDIFQKTIGMRRPLDTSDLPSAALDDDAAGQTIHLDLPESELSRDDTHSTQLWARQTGSDLNQSLTIRSRPVAGDEQFRVNDDSQDNPDYQIVEKIGEGGMGAIFLANQTSLDRQLAIKTLKATRRPGGSASGAGGQSGTLDRQRRDMFLAEALITANLVHPHIIPIHDLCETADGLPFYSMKRVVGTPWCDRLREMSLDENIGVLLKVCDAIAYAHHNGVVNRDLKPENVMLGEFGEVLVLDWGLAVPSTASDKKKFNSPSAPFGAGTPAYMAPELWTGPEEIIGYWSDIYLLGAILFEVIVGKAPHKFTEPAAKSGNTGLWMVIDKVVRRNDIRETEHQGELIDIAMKAMATRPKDRFESVLKFQEALRNFLKHEESRHLSARATETLKSTIEPEADTGYLGFQTAAALFEEAKTAWEDNAEAKTGLRDTRLAYAELAHKKGDFDLGLQIATLEDDSDFHQIQTRLLRSRRLRNTLKFAVFAASAIIVLVGVFSFVQSREIAEQNSQIIALNGTRESLKIDISAAQEKVSDAEIKLELADSKAQDAETRALAADDKAKAADRMAEEAETKLAASRRMLDEADVKLASANETLELTEAQVADLKVKKSRSAVDLRNAEIASLIRNGDYSSALNEVDQLVADLEQSNELSALPANERQQRSVELQARRLQLAKRAVRLNLPAQSQVLSPSGKLVAWGGSDGNLEIRTYSESSGIASDLVAKRKFESPISCLNFSQTGDNLIFAVGSDIAVWDYQTNQLNLLAEHQTEVTSICRSGSFLLSADQSGTIRAWSLKSKSELWSMRSSSQIIDLAFVPEDRMFIFAGSRGGESSDILAYRLEGFEDSTVRPKRLGQLQLPRTQNDPPRSLAVSPDGQKLLISNSRNGRVLVLPRRKGTSANPRDQFPFEHATVLETTRKPSEWIADRHQRPVNDIQFSSDGSQFCTASDDRTIGVWKITADQGVQLVERLEGHGAKVNHAQFADQQARFVLSIAADRYCRSWDLNSYRQDKQKLESEFKLSDMSSLQSGIVKNLQPRPIGTTAAVSFDRPMGLWGLMSLPAVVSPAASLPLVSSLVEPIESRDDQVDDSNADRSFNTKPTMQRGALTSVSVSADGSRVSTGGSDGTAVIWNTETGQPVTAVTMSGTATAAEFDEGHDFNVSRFCFLPPDGRHLLTTGFDGNLCVWNADTQQVGMGYQTMKVPGLGLVNAVAASKDGKYIVTSAVQEDGEPGVCFVYEARALLNDAEPMPTAILSGFHNAEISAITISDNGRFVATGGRDGRVAIWSSADGTLIASTRAHTRNTIVSNLHMMDDETVLSSGYDGRLLLLQTEKQTPSSSGPLKLNIIRNFEHDRIPIERLAVHPDKNSFVTISIRTDKQTQTVHYEMTLWDISSRKEARRIEPARIEGRAAIRFSSVDYSHNGSQLMAVVDQRIQLFDTSDWKVTRVIGAQTSGISDAIFAPPTSDSKSGTQIATFDGVAAGLWDLNSGKRLAAFRPLFSVASLARSSHSNPLLLTGDRALRCFQASTEDRLFGRCLFKAENPHHGVVRCLAFNPANRNMFASCGTDGTVCMWEWNSDTKEANLISRLKQEQPAKEAVGLVWAHDGRSIWTVFGNGRLLQFHVNGKVLQKAELSKDAKFELAGIDLSDDGRFVAVCGKNHLDGQSTAWIFEPAGGQLAVHCRLNGHDAGGIRAIRFLPDSPYIVTAGADGACLVWNWMPTRSNEQTIAAYEAFQFLAPNRRVAHQAPINAISVTENGEVVTVSDDGTARLWRNPFSGPTFN